MKPSRGVRRAFTRVLINEIEAPADLSESAEWAQMTQREQVISILHRFAELEESGEVGANNPAAMPHVAPQLTANYPEGTQTPRIQVERSSLSATKSFVSVKNRYMFSFGLEGRISYSGTEGFRPIAISSVSYTCCSSDLFAFSFDGPWEWIVNED